MGNLIDIQSQIEKLQKQANDIKSKEFAATVQEIQAKMQAFGITVKDLQSTKGGRGKSKSSPAKAAKAAKTPKIRKASAPVAAASTNTGGKTP